MSFASRMSRIGESATLELTRRVLQMRAAGADLVDLGAGEPDFDSPEVAVAAASDALAAGYTRYTEVGGDPALRRALAERFAATGAPWSGGRDALITVGAKAALFELALALVDDGAEVVIPSPCWVSLPEQVRLAGGEAVLVETDPADAFAIRAEPILDAIGERTRAVLVNSPCNPTGGVIERAELRRLVEACAQRRIPLISDETYDRFVFDGRSHASVSELAGDFPETCVLVGSFSKTYAMTGWRLGYVFGPEPLIARVRAIQSHATSNPTSFAMKGALAALAAEDQVRERIAEYEQRRNLVVEALARIPGVRCTSPPGTFYTFPDVSGCFGPGRQGSSELAEWLLQEAGVAVVPGIAFGADRHVRISFASSRDQLDEGLRRITRALEAVTAIEGAR
ncbi:MAG TPA: pyridoxal phosphate-dependent aminotransferase [Thermoanaerobaculia bacterium]|nr:pyridoxal phosphate-dependent aminotransferase [Thermoanaerobaculia bacterium]